MDHLFDRGPENDEHVRSFVLQNNKASNAIRVGGGGGLLSRTVVAVDATGSMSATIEACKRTIMDMFREVNGTLKEVRYGGTFELMICFYRNYSSRAELLVHSPWESDPNNLAAFMGDVRAGGGQGNEAVEVAFQYINTLPDVTQVILIGDMPPNLPSEVAHRRASTRYDWSVTPFATATTADEELEKLKAAGVPVHACWVYGCAKREFQRISEVTGGRSCKLEISKPEGATMLKELVCTTVLRDIGTRQGGSTEKGDELVKEYERMFGAGFTKCVVIESFV